MLQYPQMEVHGACHGQHLNELHHQDFKCLLSVVPSDDVEQGPQK